MTECGRCGDCCEEMYLNTTKTVLALKAKWNDPRDDEVWERWLKSWAVEDPPFSPGLRQDFIDAWLNANFILAHWHGGHRAKRKNGHETTGDWSCDQFNVETRLCMAHDDRPPICSGYPYYGEEPGATVVNLHARCTFWADYPEGARPAGWQPVSFVKRDT